MAILNQDASPTNVMRLCRKYRTFLKIIVFLLIVQLLYFQVYKRLEQTELPKKPVFRDDGHKIRHKLPIPHGFPYPFGDVHKHPSTLNNSKSLGNYLLPLANMSSKVFKPRMTTARTLLKNTTVLPLNITSGKQNETTDMPEISGGFNLEQMISNVSRIFSMPRGLNRTLIDEFKKQIAKVNTHKLFILSQETVKRQEALRFSLNRNRNQVISDDLYNSLPKVGPFVDTSFNRCSVVGSGGILLNSGCGPDIDKADYIFRCNVPPVSNFVEDAGSKNNMTTLNPSVTWKRYHSLHSSSDRTKFLRSMQAQHADILLPLFGAKSSYSTGRHITRVMKIAKNPTVTPLIIHPKHFAGIQDFWTKRGVRKRMSTGFYLTSVAIALCEEVYLYGFWPFSKDMEGRNVTYHYYDKEMLTGDVHDFSVEFSTILQLHQDGIINLQVTPCEHDESQGG